MYLLQFHIINSITQNISIINIVMYVFKKIIIKIIIILEQLTKNKKDINLIIKI